MDLILTITGVLLVLAGLIGLVVPIVPDVPLVVAGALVVLIAQHALTGAGVITVLVLGSLAYLADWLLLIYGSRKIGATTEATVGAALGLILGLGWIGLPVGGMVGVVTLPVIGATLGELVGRIGHSKRGRSPLAIGVGLGALSVLGLSLKFVLVGLILVTAFVALLIA